MRTASVATVILLIAMTVLAQNPISIRSTNGFANGLNATNFFLWGSHVGGTPGISLTLSNSELVLSAGTSQFKWNNVQNNGGEGDIVGPQGQSIEWNPNGELAFLDSGDENFFMNATAGITMGTTSGQFNIPVDGGINWLGSATGDGSGIINVNTANLAGACRIVAGGIVTLSHGTNKIATTFSNTTNIFQVSYWSRDLSVTTVGYSNVVNGTSFNVWSGNANDTNQISWTIIKP